MIGTSEANSSPSKNLHISKVKVVPANLLCEPLHEREVTKMSKEERR